MPYLVVCLTFHFIKVSDSSTKYNSAITHTIMMVYVSTCTVKNAKKIPKSIRCFSRTVNCFFNILDVLRKVTVSVTTFFYFNKEMMLQQQKFPVVIFNK